MSASGLLQPTSQVVTFTASATGPATVVTVNGQVPAVTTSFMLKFAESYYAELIVPTSAGTVDVALMHSTDNGATFRTLPLKFAQSTAASATAASVLIFKPAVGLSDAAIAPVPALTGAAVATNFPFNTRFVRPYVTLGTAGVTNFTIVFTMSQKGNVVQ